MCCSAVLRSKMKHQSPSSPPLPLCSLPSLSNTNIYSHYGDKLHRPWPRQFPVHSQGSLCPIMLHRNTASTWLMNRASPALYLLLQLLHLLAHVSSYGTGLAHLGEERGHLVGAQEPGSPALQHVQETRLHHTCGNGDRTLWVLLPPNSSSASATCSVPLGRCGPRTEHLVKYR